MILPEKVSGLEVLAKAGLRVPERRLHLTAEVLRGSCPEGLEGLLSGLQIRDFYPTLLVRSAHPLEDRFSSGAFTSPGLVLEPRNPNTPAEVWSHIQAVHRRIIEAANPSASLQVRRDIKFRGIEGYVAEDMGVFLNEAIINTRLLTVVPGRAGIRVQFQAGDHPTEYDFSAPEDHARQKLEAMPFGRSDFSIAQLKGEVDKANNAFDGEKEYEVLVDWSGQIWFVQARTPEVSKPHDLLKLADWEEGLREYQSKDPASRFFHAKPFLVSRASTDPEVRETQLLIVDEKTWRSQGSGGIERNYERLLILAEEIESYSLWIKDISVSGSSRYHPLKVPREQIASCASVQIRGWSDCDSGAENASPHVPFGTNGPRQIGVHYEWGNLNKELSGKRDGDPLTILVRKDPAVWGKDKVSINRASMI